MTDPNTETDQDPDQIAPNHSVRITLSGPALLEMKNILTNDGIELICPPGRRGRGRRGPGCR